MNHKHISTRGKRYFFLLACILVLAGCGGQAYHPAMSAEEMASEPLTGEVLAPGDVVDVRFLYNPELNDTQRVRPDGTIPLQIIGDVQAQGKTPEALQQELDRLYASQLRRPAVTVTVKSFRNNRVYVGGEVNKPGEVEIPGQLTAFEAISQAGGFNTTTAEMRNVVIIRNRHGKHYGTVVNFGEVLSGKEVTPFYLRAGDVVYVPKTSIAKVNQWVDQHINRVLPRIPISFVP